MSKFPLEPNSQMIATLGKPTGFPLLHAMLFAVSAADAVVAAIAAIIAAFATSAEETVVTTGFTDPAVPRNITATAGGTAADVAAVQVIIVGTDYVGEVITETLPAFTLNTAGSVAGAKAFATITSVTVPAMDGVGATVSIGFGDILGLPSLLTENTVIAAYLDGVIESTAPTVAMDAANISGNTIDLNSALDGTLVNVLLFI